MNPKTKKTLIFWSFLSPALIAFLLVVAIPFAIGIYYSFTDWNAIPGSVVSFVGLKNYREVFQDTQFLKALMTTIVYSLYAVVLVNIVGFFLAILVTQKMRSANLLRTTFFMPNLIGGLILGYVWKFVFLKTIPDLLAIDFNMLSKPSTALLAMAIVSTCRWVVISWSSMWQLSRGFRSH